MADEKIAKWLQDNGLENISDQYTNALVKREATGINDQIEKNDRNLASQLESLNKKVTLDEKQLREEIQKISNPDLIEEKVNAFQKQRQEAEEKLHTAHDTAQNKILGKLEDHQNDIDKNKAELENAVIKKLKEQNPDATDEQLKKSSQRVIAAAEDKADNQIKNGKRPVEKSANHQTSFQIPPDALATMRTGDEATKGPTGMPETFAKQNIGTGSQGPAIGRTG